MNEIAPGLYHWSTYHEAIRTRVSSYYIEPAALVIDPKIPEDGVESLPGTPQQVALTIGLHHRDAKALADHFGGLPIRVSHEGAERLDGRLQTEPYGDGDEIALGVRALAIGQIAPDEYALHIAHGGGAIAFADGLINYGGLGFVPDHLIGDHADSVKSGLRDAFRRLLDLDFKHLLFAHGDPVVDEGKTPLERFLES